MIEKNKQHDSPLTDGVKPETQSRSDQDKNKDKDRPREIGGRKEGLEPTRYGDWEKNGRCIDF